MQIQEEYQTKWEPIDNFDFSNNLLGFSVDTRDFNILKTEELLEVKDYNIIKKYPGFFFTISEVKELIYELYHKTGGEGSWRSIFFKEVNKTGWFKYLRIRKTDKGYVVGGSSSREVHFYKKSFYKGEIEYKKLMTH